LLRGTEGRACVYVNPAGFAVGRAPSRQPVPGPTLRLSLDLGLQKRFARALAPTMHTGADLGAGVVLDPRSGQVLAMVSVPSYNDNVFGPPIRTAALNRLAHRAGYPELEHATQVEAPPGSTFKLVVASADMRHRAVPPNLVVPTGGSWTLFGHTFHNWSALPPQDLVQAIAWSNDVYFYKLAWALGAHAIATTARQLGVGHVTGIDLPGEYSGFLGTPSSVAKAGGTWYPGSTVLLGIGQGYLAVTPLQDAVWASGVATGSVITPHLGMSMVPARGAAKALPFPAPRQLPFAPALGPVRAGMRAAVTSGTAQLLAGLPDAAGGKTGTAEDPTAPAGTDTWLSAVAPMRHPIVEATGFVHGGAGWETASPPVQAVLSYFLAHKKAILATGAARH
jgi:cell division protein FtsI/penicillin-binding protein 2